MNVLATLWSCRNAKKVVTVLTAEFDFTVEPKYLRNFTNRDWDGSDGIVFERGETSFRPGETPYVGFSNERKEAQKETSANFRARAKAAKSEGIDLPVAKKAKFPPRTCHIPGCGSKSAVKNGRCWLAPPYPRESSPL